MLFPKRPSEKAKTEKRARPQPSKRKRAEHLRVGKSSSNCTETFGSSSHLPLPATVEVKLTGSQQVPTIVTKRESERTNKK